MNRKERNGKINRGNNKNIPKNRSKTSVIKKSTSIPKEIKPQFTWLSVKPNRTNHGVTHIS